MFNKSIRNTFYFAIISLLTSKQSICQKPDTVNEETLRWVPAKDVAWPEVDIEAKFGNSESKWLNYLDTTLDTQVPYRNKAPKGTFEVIIRFVVLSNGSLQSFFPESRNGYGLEDEVIRVLKKSSSWIPGQLNGRPVNSVKRQSVTFVVM